LANSNFIEKGAKIKRRGKMKKKNKKKKRKKQKRKESERNEKHCVGPREIYSLVFLFCGNFMIYAILKK